MNNIPRVPPEKQLFSAVPVNSSEKLVLRSEEWLVNWKMCTVSTFCKAEELVEDTYAGTLATAEARLQLPQQRCSVGCESDLTSSV